MYEQVFYFFPLHLHIPTFYLSANSGYFMNMQIMFYCGKLVIYKGSDNKIYPIVLYSTLQGWK